MSTAQSPEELIRLPLTPAIKDKFIGLAGQTDELDQVTREIGAPAYLLNFYCATPIDLSSIGLGKALHIPVQVSQREGGRKSVFDLSPGEEVLVGIIVTNEGLALRFMTRKTGNSSSAQTGDIYSTRITNREGEAFFESEGPLEIGTTSEDRAHFRTTAAMLSGTQVPALDGGWSCVAISKCMFSSAE